MPDNDKPKGWRMYMKAEKEEEFTVCPWTGCTWKDNGLNYSEGTNKWGIFKAIGGATPNQSYGVQYAFNKPGSGSFNYSMKGEEGSATLELPEGVLICPKFFWVKADHSADRGAYVDTQVKGFNAATGAWEMLYNYYYRDSHYAKSEHSVTLNTSSFYSKFYIWTRGRDSTNPWVSIGGFDVRSGIIKYK